MRLLSPSSTPPSRSPPGPATDATRATAHCLSGPIEPRRLGDQPRSVTRRAFRFPATPVRNDRRPHSSAPGVFTDPSTSTCRPSTGISPSAGQSTLTIAPAQTGPMIRARELEPNLPAASSVRTSTTQGFEPASCSCSTSTIQCDQYSPPRPKPAASPRSRSARVVPRVRANATPATASTAQPAASGHVRAPSPARPAFQTSVSASAIPDQSENTSQARGGSDGRISARLGASLDTDEVFERLELLRADARHSA
jgi:hypothetical protein